NGPARCRATSTAKQASRAPAKVKRRFGSSCTSPPHQIDSKRETLFLYVEEHANRTERNGALNWPMGGHSRGVSTSCVIGSTSAKATHAVTYSFFLLRGSLLVRISTCAPSPNKQLSVAV